MHRNWHKFRVTQFCTVVALFCNYKQQHVEIFSSSIHLGAVVANNLLVVASNNSSDAMLMGLLVRRRRRQRSHWLCRGIAGDSLCWLPVPFYSLCRTETFMMENTLLKILATNRWTGLHSVQRGRETLKMLLFCHWPVLWSARVLPPPPTVICVLLLSIRPQNYHTIRNVLLKCFTNIKWENRDLFYDPGIYIRGIS